ncbi:hypothetical protein [Teredinibacter sp. KSP-S5-2]|uniref:hypothetical protein n=1 Tax=Teredinibacter sp. KSP-S5-2 TaxID=3034506 RepID=UPI0029346AFF|nr:hypothetical protein [Teredinibacter sp. KSP-S5-2]WNO10492.1 hypothetical protein P5V12_04835 [Teredinibacter sp. KSP-S5-2]
MSRTKIPEYFVETFNAPLVDESSPSRVLLISGAGATVKILATSDGSEFVGGNISGANIEQTVYVPIGEDFFVRITGVDSNVLIQKELMPYVSISGTASGSIVGQL